MFSFHVLNLNVNECVPVKGCIHWGYGQMDPIGSIRLMFRPLMCYGYTVIQVVYWVELLEQRMLCLIFFKNMDPDKWDTAVWYRVTRNPQEFRWLKGCQRDPWIWGVIDITK